MSDKIYFVTSRYLCGFLEKRLRDLKLDCSWETIVYNNFSDLAQLTPSLPDDAAGFITIGSVTKAVILKAVPALEVPLVTLDTDLASLYHMVIELLNADRALDLNRVFIDFYTTPTSPTPCMNLLDGDWLHMAAKSKDDLLAKSDLDTLLLMETESEEGLLSLWKNGKMDFAICFYSSVAAHLQELHIPSDLVYPSSTRILQAIDQIKAAIVLSRLRQARPAVICVAPPRGKRGAEADWETALLQKSILDYNRERMADFLVKKEIDWLEIYTSRAVLARITEDFQRCDLRDYLCERTGSYPHVGYGVGADNAAAQQNALRALRCSAQGDGSYVVTEDHSLIGPLTARDTPFVSKNPSPQVVKMAKKAGLSTLTIQRILHVIKNCESTQISAKDFVDHFGGTIRNANRILGNLEKSGLAVAVNTQSNYATGRPAKIYQLIRDNPR